MHNNFFPTVYSLVQFVDDGILAICTTKNIKTRDVGRKEAQYGDGYYLCTVMFESGKLSHSILKLQLLFMIIHQIAVRLEHHTTKQNYMDV